MGFIKRSTVKLELVGDNLPPGWVNAKAEEAKRASLEEEEKEEETPKEDK